jgi:hypothetical protein
MKSDISKGWSVLCVVSDGIGDWVGEETSL